MKERFLSFWRFLLHMNSYPNAAQLSYNFKTTALSHFYHRCLLGRLLLDGSERYQLIGELSVAYFVTEETFLPV